MLMVLAEATGEVLLVAVAVGVGLVLVVGVVLLFRLIKIPPTTKTIRTTIMAAIVLFFMEFLLIVNDLYLMYTSL